jgi:putative tryptophan/tyrosine transport system substrate-binding protein
MRAASSSLRRRLLQGIGLAIWGPVALAQPGGKARRVGIVFSTDPRTSAPYLDALARGLEQHGYRRDRDFVVDVRHAEGRPERYPALVRELLDARAEVIVVGANSSVLAAKSATSTVPIVMAGALAPDAMGLVASLARPGGNVTGVANMSGSVTAKRLQLLHELVPGATRIAYLTNPAVPGWDRTVKTVEDAGAAMALRIATATASTPEEIDRMLASLAEQRPDAILVGNAVLFWMHRRRIIDFCARHRIPAGYAHGEVVREGGLTSYSSSLEDTFRMAGTFVARILGGAKPADLPVEQPTRYELFVNATTAKALGILIPAAIRANAEIVE